MSPYINLTAAAEKGQQGWESNRQLKGKGLNPQPRASTPRNRDGSIQTIIKNSVGHSAPNEIEGKKACPNADRTDKGRRRTSQSGSTTAGGISSADPLPPFGKRARERERLDNKIEGKGRERERRERRRKE
jgi:hypothetical protein